MSEHDTVFYMFLRLHCNSFFDTGMMYSKHFKGSLLINISKY